MFCSSLFIYFNFFIIYLIFFFFLFNSKIESLIFIFLFILSIFSGFKIIIDLYKNKNFVLDLKPLQQFFMDDSMQFYNNLLFSPIITIILTIILLGSVYIHVTGGNIPLQFLLFSSISLVLFILIQLGNYFKFIPLFVVLGIPILFIIISLILIMIIIKKYNTNASVKNSKFSISSINKNEILKYKIVFILEMILLFFFLFYYYITNDIIDNTVSQFYSYFIIPLLYFGSSYMIYVANNISQLNVTDQSDR